MKLENTTTTQTFAEIKPEALSTDCYVDLGNIFWVHIASPIEGTDEAQDRCKNCCEKEVENLKSKYPHLEVSVDGGWDRGHEVEEPPRCHDCGEPLCGYLLNTYINPYHWTEDDLCMYDRDTWAKSEAKFTLEQNS